MGAYIDQEEEEKKDDARSMASEEAISNSEDYTINTESKVQ